MMYDPPDYPYNTDEFIFNNETVPFTNTSTAEAKTVKEDNLQSKRIHADYLSLDNALPILDSSVLGTDLLVVSNETLSFEPILLDDQTVNQFLLPLQANTDEKKNENHEVPDLLALQSCVLCHEIFTSDADLLDHTISVHVSDNSLEESQSIAQPLSAIPTEDVNLNDQTTSISSLGLGEEWFICSVCQRVLSTALEIEPTEQLCCSDISGKSSVTRKVLESMYVCDGCSGLFGDGEALDRHKVNCNTGNETSFFIDNTVAEPSIEIPTYSEVFFDCDSCGKQCASAEELKIHATSCDARSPTYAPNERRSYVRNSSSKMWNCGSCNQLFPTARELYRHKRGEDRAEGAPLTAYRCEECNKVLGSMCALHTHRKMHKNVKPGYPCQICGRRFNQSGHLAIHMRMHTGERPYPCDLCPKAFKVKVERDDHRRTHTGERPFACAACPKTFTAAARLREHARIHTDQRPYKCEICGAAFRRPYARTVHTLIHTGEKPHECDICGTAFRRSGDMWKHKRTIHGTQLPDDAR